MSGPRVNMPWYKNKNERKKRETSHKFFFSRFTRKLAMEEVWWLPPTLGIMTRDLISRPHLSLEILLAFSPSPLPDTQSLLISFNPSLPLLAVQPFSQHNSQRANPALLPVFFLLFIWIILFLCLAPPHIPQSFLLTGRRTPFVKLKRWASVSQNEPRWPCFCKTLNRHLNLPHILPPELQQYLDSNYQEDLGDHLKPLEVWTDLVA